MAGELSLSQFNKSLRSGGLSSNTGLTSNGQPYTMPQVVDDSLNLSAYNAATAGGGGTGGGGGGGGGGSAPAAPTQEQIRAQQANAMKSGVKGLVNSILGVYDAMYGDVSAAAADKVNQVQGVYKEDVDALTQQFGEEFPTIGRGFSARGTGSSGYRFDAEQAARQGFDRTLGSRARVRDQDLSTVGQTVAQQQAQIGADRGLNAGFLAQIDASTNPDELTQLQAELTKKIANLNAERAGLGTRAGYLAKLNETVPGGSQLPGLRQSLSNVISSQVPTQVKQAIGVQLIQSAGLPQSQVDALLGEFNGQLSDQDKQPIAA